MTEIIMLIAALCADASCAEIQTPDGKPLATCLDGKIVEYISMSCDSGGIIEVSALKKQEKE